MKTTNVYLLVDSSYDSARFFKQIQQFILKAQRTANSFPFVRLHIIGYNDKAKVLSPFDKLKTFGNSNLSSGLDLLHSIMNYNKKYTPIMSRSIVIWLSAGNVLREYENSFYKLNKQSEFSKAIRYVIEYKQPDNYTKTARYLFASNVDGVLTYFSENRLKRLIEQLNNSF